MFHDFQEFALNLWSLDKRLRYFNVHGKGKSVSVEDVKSAVNKELMEPGQLLGYRAVDLKLKTLID